MGNSEGVYQFIEYLDKLNEMGHMFKGINTATEIMGELPLTEEQIEVANVLLEKIQDEWSEGFIQMLEFGVKWLKNQKELSE